MSKYLRNKQYIILFFVRDLISGKKKCMSYDGYTFNVNGAKVYTYVEEAESALKYVREQIEERKNSKVAKVCSEPFIAKISHKSEFKLKDGGKLKFKWKRSYMLSCNRLKVFYDYISE